jgi:hypothetical protein
VPIIKSAGVLHFVSELKVGGFELTNALPKLAFEVWPEFPFISERLAIRETFPG